MRAFDFVAADALDRAQALVAGHASAAIAGGTSLLDLMKLGVEAPGRLVDINALPLAAIEPVAGGVRIGALARNSDAAYDPLVRERFPALAEALLAGASAQLRNMATVGGNLMQRTRCSYFRETTWTACNKRLPGSGCAALDGFHRNHAVLGTSDACIATHPSDMAVALAALDAIVVLQSSRSERRVSVGDFHLAPGTTPERETVIEPGELIVAVELFDSVVARRSTYVKLRDRASYAFALASAACGVEVGADGLIADARIALGGVATKPWRASGAEATLLGKRPSREAYRAAAEAAFADARPRRDNAFKIDFGKRAIVRAFINLEERQ